MTHETTTREKKKEAPDNDLAPGADAAFGATDASNSGHAPHPASHGIHLESAKRLKTHGEKKFNWITYFGFAMIGNEVVSTFITHARKNWAKQYYEPFEKLFTNLKGKRFVPEYVSSGALPTVLVALIGGMTMVPFVKNMEDHKGEKVRKYDRKYYGPERAENDPAIVAAHKEMDEAPKQSWGSLWKGRIVTVLAAIGLDSTIGWKDALSTKLFKDNPTYQKYSSMDRLATQISEKTMNVLGIVKDVSRKRVGDVLQTASWLLVFSSALTAIFYISSKVFARKRDEKLEHRELAHAHSTPARDEAAEVTPEASQAAETPREASPSPKVQSVAHEKPLAAMPSLQFA